MIRRLTQKEGCVAPRKHSIWVMEAKVFLVAVLAACLAETYGACPAGSIQGLKDDDCYRSTIVTALTIHGICSCFRYHEIATTWYEAEDICVRLGGHLASVENAFANAFLSDSWNFGNSGYWLGGSYGVSTSRKWTWTDGKPFAFVNWAKGNLRKHACIRMH